MNGDYTVDSDYVLYDWGTFSLTRTINIIRASAGAGGNISPSGDVSVNAGSNQIFQINPDTGYRVLDVVVDGTSVGAKTSHTFYNLSSNHTISATFALAPTNDTEDVIKYIHRQYRIRIFFILFFSIYSFSSSNERDAGEGLGKAES